MSPNKKQKVEEPEEDYVPKNILLTGGAGTSVCRDADKEKGRK